MFDVFSHRYSSSPKKDAQDIGCEQHEAHPGGEALTGAAPLDLLVLGDVGQGSAQHHQTGRQPGQGRPHVILLLRVHPGVTLTDRCYLSFHLEGSRAELLHTSSFDASGDWEINTRARNGTFPGISFNSGRYVQTSVLTKSENSLLVTFSQHHVTQKAEECFIIS